MTRVIVILDLEEVYEQERKESKAKLEAFLVKVMGSRGVKKRHKKNQQMTKDSAGIRNVPLSPIPRLQSKTRGQRHWRKQSHWQ
jgi:hypothetical protein